MPEDCLFCRIADQLIPVELLYNDDMVVAFRDINPQAPVHILLVPKKHFPDVRHLGDVDADLLARLFKVASQLAKQEGIDAGGFRLVVNTGADAGQSVQHIHVHLLGGRQLGWPPG